jgi:hypothetical protein
MRVTCNLLPSLLEQLRTQSTAAPPRLRHPNIAPVASVSRPSALPSSSSPALGFYYGESVRELWARPYAYYQVFEY